MPEPTPYRFRLAPPILRLSLPAGDVADAPATFSKDILRVGRWNVNGSPWTVTPHTLRQIHDNFHLARRRGLRVPVMWNHSDDARDKCGEVTDLRIQGDDLHATFVIALPEDARRLQLLNDEVSVEVTPNAVDGEGNKYDLLLTHVGVVTLPVVPGQGPIRRLALAQEGNDVPEDKPTIDEGATSIEVVDLVKLLSDKLGLKFPEGVDTVKEFNIAIEAMLGKTDDAAKDEPPPAEAISEQPAEEIPMQMRTRVIEALRSDNRAIQLRLKAIEDQRAAEKRAAFETRLNGFCKTGQLTPADIPAWLKLGEQASYQLSLLAPLERCAPAIPMGRVVGQHASAQPAEDRWAKGAATAKAVLGRK